uniref:Hypothetical homing endonuclease n=1 Tax=Bracteacoccus aerius TaxID=50041 RepID=A0A076VKC5_9CHLO|nr:hypothetical homing endonuclease [Bracteacoccus aerius]AIK29071.1 hypothetical homing endonuclease [Bracteacoccus aerius]
MILLYGYNYGQIARAKQRRGFCNSVCQQACTWDPVAVQQRYKLEKPPVLVKERSSPDLRDGNFRRSLGKQAGIYGWFNKKTGHGYVGRTVNLSSRPFNHMPPLRGISRASGRRSNSRLQKAILMDGLESFVFIVFETIADPVQVTGELLQARENYYMQHVDSVYNKTKTSSYGFWNVKGFA